jgi:hypothetical protein
MCNTNSTFSLSFYLQWVVRSPCVIHGIMEQMWIMESLWIVFKWRETNLRIVSVWHVMNWRLHLIACCVLYKRVLNNILWYYTMHLIRNAIVQNNSHDQCWTNMQVSSWCYTIIINNGIKEFTVGIKSVTLVKSRISGGYVKLRDSLFIPRLYYSTQYIPF